MIKTIKLLLVLIVINYGCGGNDEFGMSAPIVSQSDIYGVWIQRSTLDGNVAKYETYDTTGNFILLFEEPGNVFPLKKIRKKGVAKFLDNSFHLQRVVSSSEFYDRTNKIWVSEHLSEPDIDTVEFHLNSYGFWVREHENLPPVYARQWRKVEDY